MWLFWSLLHVASILNAKPLPWSWDTLPIWADFYTRDASLISDYQAQFLANNYDILSLEKCLGNSANNPNVSTEQEFYNISQHIRQYGNANKTKILFYFHTSQCFYKCYDITDSFMANKSMWFKDDYGNILYGSGGDPYYDHTQQYVREWWINAVETVMKTALDQSIIVNGIFADGAGSRFSNNKNVSTDRSNEYHQGVLSLFDGVRQQFSKINDDLYVIANGISTYSQTIAPDHNLDIMPHVDGMLGEHFGSFEEILPNSKGKLNPTDLLFWYNASKSIQNGVYGEDKILLIKSWIGPESQPITSFGPSWPTDYDAATPTTYQQLQNASTALITFPLAVYLCGIYDRNVLFSYTWWYGINEGVVPCPDDPNSCGCPVNWYKEFTNKLGPPKSDGIITDTYKCNRSFEYAEIYVDLNDDSSAIIKWS